MVKKINLIKKIFLENDNPESIKTKVVKVICGFIVLMLPAEKWYQASFNIYLLMRHLKYFNQSSPLFQVKRVNVLNQILSLLTRTGIPFHIAYEFNSNNIKNENGFLICTTHLPLMKVGIRALIENNYRIDALIAQNPTKDMKIAIWGMKEKIAALKVDSNVLLKTKSFLLKNDSILVMIDIPNTNIYSPNSMKICGLTGSMAIFIFAKLNKNGIIQIWLESPPFPFCKTDSEIQENIKELKYKTNQILEEYSNRSY